MAWPICVLISTAAAFVVRPHVLGGHAQGFAVPQSGAAREWSRGRRTSRRCFSRDRRSSGFVEGWPAGRQTRRAQGSKVALTLGVPDVGNEELLATAAGLAARMLLWAGTAVGGLVALLYITSAFEVLMHSTSGLLSGRSPTVAAVTGLAIGALHTVAGPDHLAGLAPLVVGQRRSPLAAFGLGAVWGSGHATGQLLIGMACLAVHVGLLRTDWAPALEQATGFLVGTSLVAIGLLGFREAREYEDTAVAERGPEKRRRFGWATYATGVLHGLSPDAIMFILPALALPRLAATTHVLGVVTGTLVSMGTCTALLGALCRRSPRLRTISTGASSVAVLLGACIFAASLGLTVPLPGLGH